MEDILEELKKMGYDFTALQASLTSETNAVTAASQLLASYTTQLQQAIANAGSLSQADQATLNGIVTSWQAQNTALAAAVAANTPAEAPAPAVAAPAVPVPSTPV